MQYKENQVRDVKRLNEKKRRRRKKRAAVFAVIFLFLSVIVFWILTQTVLFPIEQIVITGNSMYSVEEIADASLIKAGDKIFAVSEKQINNNITHTLPYVKTVDLKRTSFSSIKLSVTETVDVYCYNSNGKFITADRDNKLLASFDAQPTNTVLIKPDINFEHKIGYVLEIEEEKLKLINSIYDKLTEKEIAVNEIDLSKTANIVVTIKNRFSVNFGTETDLDSKINHLTSMLVEIDAKNGNTCTGKIDLSAWSVTKREGYFEKSVNF